MPYQKGLVLFCQKTQFEFEINYLTIEEALMTGYLLLTKVSSIGWNVKLFLFYVCSTVLQKAKAKNCFPLKSFSVLPADVEVKWELLSSPRLLLTSENHAMGRECCIFAFSTLSLLILNSEKLLLNLCLIASWQIFSHSRSSYT